MHEPTPQRLTLELQPEVAFLPAAERAALVCGLGGGGAQRLALAVEEFFAHLCRFAGCEEPLRFILTQGGTLLHTAFRFRAGNVSLRAAATRQPGWAC